MYNSFVIIKHTLEELEMKKKLAIAVAMSCALMAGVVTGCGNKEEAAPAATTVAATEAATTAAESTEVEAETEAETETETEAETEVETEAETKAADSASGDYTSWTGKEWSAASDDEKLAATRFYLIETTKLTAEAMGQEYTSEMEAAYTDDVIKASIPTLDAAFAADASMTLQQLLDMTAEAAEGMAAYAVPQTP